MKKNVFLCSVLLGIKTFAAPDFSHEKPISVSSYQINSTDLCATAKETLTYINKGTTYDPNVIHGGKIFKVPLERVKATLAFICQHQNEMNNPSFVKQHFDFIRWYPDMKQVEPLKSGKPLLNHLPHDKILMTKYYVHRATVAKKTSKEYPFALYGIPEDEASLTLDEANTKSYLTRFHYGKQAILNGALTNRNVPVLAYLKRDDLEAALMQGTIVADFGNYTRTFNVSRCNNISYIQTKNPYHQERYWYFKQVNGIKGYGKDGENKITINNEVSFAADLEQFGLGKLLMIQYPDKSGKIITRAGIFADTGGAFQKNQYQIDFLAGSFTGREAFYRTARHLPNYVNAYFMILKK